MKAQLATAVALLVSTLAIGAAFIRAATSAESRPSNLELSLPPNACAIQCPATDTHPAIGGHVECPIGWVPACQCADRTAKLGYCEKPRERRL